MFDVSVGEILVIGAVALVVIGPKELPGVIRSAGRMVARLRTMAADFRKQFDDVMQENELDELRREYSNFKQGAQEATQSFQQPISSFQQELKTSLTASPPPEQGELAQGGASFTLPPTPFYEGSPPLPPQELTSLPLSPPAELENHQKDKKGE